MNREMQMFQLELFCGALLCRLSAALWPVMTFLSPL